METGVCGYLRKGEFCIVLAAVRAEQCSIWEQCSVMER